MARAPIPRTMNSIPIIDMERLKADMAAEVARTSGRAFSRAVTGGVNEDYYRNFKGGQDKRISAEAFLGIVNALGRSPFDYIEGMDLKWSMPSATVLTSTFAILLDSIGVDPYEGERAQKLAAQFPSALQSVERLHASAGAPAPRPGGDPPLADEDQPSV